MSKYKIGDIIDKDNYKSALTILNNEIALNSNNGDLYRWRGRAKYFLKKYLIENTSNKGFKAIAHDDFAKFYSIDKFQESIDDYNIAIECQGQQHFKPIKYFGGESELNTIIERDRIKKDLCELHNIKILYYSDKKNTCKCNTENVILNLDNLMEEIMK